MVSIILVLVVVGMLPHASRVYHSLVWYVVTRHCHEHDDRNNHIRYQVTTFWMMRRTDHHDHTRTRLENRVFHVAKPRTRTAVKRCLGNTMLWLVSWMGTARQWPRRVPSAVWKSLTIPLLRNAPPWCGLVVGSTRTVASIDTQQWGDVHVGGRRCECWHPAMRKTKAMSA